MKDTESDKNATRKTPEEIKKALMICTNFEEGECESCPYFEYKGRDFACAPIFAEDVIERFQQLEREKKYLLEERELNDFLRDKVKKLEVQVPKWISVEERLPRAIGSHCQNVIVLTVNEQVMPGFCNHGLWYVMRPEDDYCNDADDGEVTHWMPLPEPPKE